MQVQVKMGRRCYLDCIIIIIIIIIQYYLDLYVQFGLKLLLVVGCTHHEDALHAEGVGDVRSRAGALCPPTI